MWNFFCCCSSRWKFLWWKKSGLCDCGSKILSGGGVLIQVFGSAWEGRKGKASDKLVVSWLRTPKEQKSCHFLFREEAVWKEGFCAAAAGAVCDTNSTGTRLCNWRSLLLICCVLVTAHRAKSTAVTTRNTLFAYWGQTDYGLTAGFKDSVHTVTSWTLGSGVATRGWIVLEASRRSTRKPRLKMKKSRSR